MKTVKLLYVNKRNRNKFLIVHRSSCGHYTAKQVMIWNDGNRTIENYTGDGYFHRWKKKNLLELLSDYICLGQCLK